MPSFSHLILSQKSTIRINVLHKYLADNGAACSYDSLFAFIRKNDRVFKIVGQEIQIIDDDRRKALLEKLNVAETEIERIGKLKDKSTPSTGEYKEYIPAEDLPQNQYETFDQKRKRTATEKETSRNSFIDQGKTESDPAEDKLSSVGGKSTLEDVDDESPKSSIPNKVKDVFGFGGNKDTTGNEDKDESVEHTAEKPTGGFGGADDGDDISGENKNENLNDGASKDAEQ